MRMRIYILLLLVVMSSPYIANGQLLCMNMPDVTQKFITNLHVNLITTSGSDITNLSRVGRRISVSQTDCGTAYVRVIDSMDALYLFFGSSFIGQKLNFINVNTYTLNSFGSPLSTDTGLVTNGSTQYVSTNYNLNTNGTARLGWGIYIRNNTGSTVGGNGVQQSLAGTNGSYYQLNLSNVAYWTVNSNYQSFANTNTAGYWWSQRSSSTSATLYKNGSSVSTNTVAANSPLALIMTFGAINTNGSIGNFIAENLAEAHINKGILDATATLSLYNAIVSYNTSLTPAR